MASPSLVIPIIQILNLFISGTAVTGGMAGPGVSAGSYSSLGAGARLRRQYGGPGGGGGSGGSVENSSDDDYSRRGPMETDKDK